MVFNLKQLKWRGEKFSVPVCVAAASGLKPGDAETRFAMIFEEAKLEHPHRY
jgi:hypothetical protein